LSSIVGHSLGGMSILNAAKKDNKTNTAKIIEVGGY
jgi:hypothetical protein